MRTVILAAGTMPALGGEGERLLRAAKRVVACDSAALAFRRRFHRWPEVAIGDLDSLSAKVGCTIIRDDDDTTNDLVKAIRYCRKQNWNDLVIVGATGGREDHTLSNVYRALAEQVPIITDFGAFLPIAHTISFYAPYNTGVSIFALEAKTRMKSQGLQWPLDGVKFTNPWCATLNRVDASRRVMLSTNCPAYVFIERNPALRRVILSLGSNLDTAGASRRDWLDRARDSISAFAYLLDASEIIETNPVDVPKEYQNLKFLNQVVLIETDLKPMELLKATAKIEHGLGRVRTVRNGPRTIDIDIIDYEGVRMKTKKLTLPHPRAKKRAFVMEPLKTLGITSFGKRD